MTPKNHMGGGEGAKLAARLVGCLPAATFEMETFCRLAGVDVSKKVPTAAVECVSRPRLLINPDFAEKHCKRDEHLFLLVMHELWHVILAHTRLYPRMTTAHNIAFDAIINAGLSRQFSEPQYMGFFDALNPPDKFPHLLLRPPVGWPDDPQYPEDIGPEGTLDVLKRLYPPKGARWQPPLYEEILALLRKYLLENGGVWVFVDGDPVLLGDHSEDGDKNAVRDALFGSILQRVVSSWPPPPFPTRSRGDGGHLSTWMNTAEAATEGARRVFANTLRQALIIRPGPEKRRAKQETPGVSGMSVMPNARDRTAPARRQLGGPGMLWNQQGMIKARIPETPAKTHVYLDVSGSMSGILPHLLGLLLPYVAKGKADVFQFSTRVEPLPLSRLRKGNLTTTFGTDINCVLHHALEFKPPIKRILILTDGYVGRTRHEYSAALLDRGLKLYVVLPAESAHTADLQDLAAGMTILPPIRF
jgi:hypothetical protein